MAKKYIATADQSAQQNITESGHTWILPWDVKITSAGNGVYESGAYSGNQIVIDGQIVCNNPTYSAVYSDSVAPDISIGKSGYISAAYGVQVLNIQASASIANAGIVEASVIGLLAAGLDNMVENTGIINADYLGISAGAWSGAERAKVFNSGTIQADNGIMAWAPDMEIELSAASRIIADVCIDAKNSYGWAADVVNAGLLRGANSVYLGGNGVDTFVNKGTIFGDILLDAGADIFRSKGGAMRGTVYGGTGDDTFHIDHARVQIQEFGGGGSDTVYSSVSYTLTASEVEFFTLTGKADIDGVGTAFGEIISGNSGKNALDGLGGADRLSGGKGNDVLKGGGGADIFVFSTGFAKDRIIDFTDGEDRIDLSGFKAIKNFSDLTKNHMVEKSAGVVIKSGDDQLTVDGTAIAGFQESDFIFG